MLNFAVIDEAVSLFSEHIQAEVRSALRELERREMMRRPIGPDIAEILRDLEQHQKDAWREDRRVDAVAEARALRLRGFAPELRNPTPRARTRSRGRTCGEAQRYRVKPC